MHPQGFRGEAGDDAAVFSCLRQDIVSWNGVECNARTF